MAGRVVMVRRGSDSSSCQYVTGCSLREDIYLDCNQEVTSSRSINVKSIYSLPSKQAASLTSTKIIIVNFDK